MSASHRPPPRLLLAVLRVFASGLLLIVGLVLIHQGIQRGIIEREIVSRPSGGRGAAFVVVGSDAVLVGIGLGVLGAVFLYGAVKIFRERDSGVGDG